MYRSGENTHTMTTAYARKWRMVYVATYTAEGRLKLEWASRQYSAHAAHQLACHGSEHVHEMGAAPLPWPRAWRGVIGRAPSGAPAWAGPPCCDDEVGADLIVARVPLCICLVWPAFIFLRLPEPQCVAAGTGTACGGGGGSAVRLRCSHLAARKLRASDEKT